MKWLLALFGISIAEGIWRAVIEWRAREAAGYEAAEQWRLWRESHPDPFGLDAAAAEPRLPSLEEVLLQARQSPDRPFYELIEAQSESERLHIAPRLLARGGRTADNLVVLGRHVQFGFQIANQLVRALVTEQNSQFLLPGIGQKLVSRRGVAKMAVFNDVLDRIPSALAPCSHFKRGQQ